MNQDYKKYERLLKSLNYQRQMRLINEINYKNNINNLLIKLKKNSFQNKQYLKNKIYNSYKSFK